MIQKTWYFLPINPIPWTVPNFSPIRKNGKLISVPAPSQAAVDFKKAIQDELKRLDAFMLEGNWHKITICFWRKLDKYEDSIGRTRTKNWADSSNMFKLAEDALQGILIKNDRQNFETTGRIIQQSAETVPGILILCETFNEIPKWAVPEEFADSEGEILQAINDAEYADMDATAELAKSNVWPPRP